APVNHSRPPDTSSTPPTRFHTRVEESIGLALRPPYRSAKDETAVRPACHGGGVGAPCRASTGGANARPAIGPAVRDARLLHAGVAVAREIVASRGLFNPFLA